MKKWIIMLMLLFLNILSLCYALPNPDADPNPEANPDPAIIIQVLQRVGGEGSRNDHCERWIYPCTNWPSTYPNYCSGQSQSPININTTDIPTSSLTPIITGYEDPISTVNIENNGHSMVVSWEGPPTVTVSRVGLGVTYTLAQFHFHWGCENDRGSEHTVDGQRYPMELHFVTYKSPYTSVKEAIASKDSDGLFVLGVFFNVGAENAALKPISDYLYKIRTCGLDCDINFNKAIGDLIPSTFNNSYLYDGSLTTPKCNEVVTWAVVKVPLELSQDQLDEFRKLQKEDGGALCDNYREVQPLNGRIVFENI